MPEDAARRGLASRREFLRLAAAAGLLGAAGAGCAGDAAPEAPPPVVPPEPPHMGPEYLARGLAALSDAHRRGWVSGHHGASVLSAYYFPRDNGADARTARALRAQVDRFIARSPAEFPVPDPGRGSADPARIVERLSGQVHQLRSGGHDAIFAALALRALRDLPEYATPAIVDGVCRLLEAHAAERRPIAESRHNIEHPLPPYGGAGDVAEATLRATLRPWGSVMQIGASGVLHWVTHAEALVTLDELGHGEVSRLGWTAHRLHINRPVERGGRTEPDRPPVDWLGPEYWESDAPRLLLDGSWLFGHAFKLPYSLFRLLRRVDDPALRAACLARATRLPVPFEPREG